MLRGVIVVMRTGLFSGKPCTVLLVVIRQRTL